MVSGSDGWCRNRNIYGDMNDSEGGEVFNTDTFTFRGILDTKKFFECYGSFITMSRGKRFSKEPLPKMTGIEQGLVIILPPLSNIYIYTLKRKRRRYI